jgi:hypothetical protein
MKPPANARRAAPAHPRPPAASRPVRFPVVVRASFRRLERRQAAG